ncbi:HTH-like domain-containing protein [Streptomyces atratus]|uniref:HTH-like domain-containing protein n=2 Tax=Streptomyces atratus TaxID=1893 RepID=A0A1K2F7Y0_STRAR|nr:HTH-like domain-containing protein [Streptomyces atratus]
MCKILGVSRSGYYVWRAALPAAEAQAGEETELVTEIRKLHTQSRRAYGSPRITAALRRKGRRGEGAPRWRWPWVPVLRGGAWGLDYQDYAPQPAGRLEGARPGTWTPGSKHSAWIVE